MDTEVQVEPARPGGVSNQRKQREQVSQVSRNRHSEYSKEKEGVAEGPFSTGRKKGGLHRKVQSLRLKTRSQAGGKG